MPEALAQVRCFLLDMDGTFFLGDQLLEGALDFIRVLRQQQKRFLFLTNNSSKQRGQYVEKISRLGLPISEGDVLTSGEATGRYLQSRRPAARLYVAGTPALEAEMAGFGFELDSQQPDIVVLGFDTTLTYAKLWKLCDLVRAGLPYIATHPDFNCPTETGFMPDIGAIIAFVEASTGRRPDVIVGKPNRLIVEAAAQKVGLAVEALGMIGDRLYTDIALGPAAGITTVLVLSGETQPGDLVGSPFRPDYVFPHLGAVGAWLAVHGQALGAEGVRSGV